ncbi:MAG: hypothetical protein RLZZ502_907, partial [Pseudomonadota bacterium]
MSSVLRLMRQYKKEVLILTLYVLVGVLVAAVFNAASPKLYRGHARLLPPQANIIQTNQLDNTGTILGSALSIKNPAELYIALLRSRAVIEPVIEQFQLTAKYKATDDDTTQRIFLKRMSVTLAKDGIIELEFEDESAQVAAEVCNHLVEEIYALGQRFAKEEDTRRQSSYDQWLSVARNRLHTIDEQV